MKKKFLFLALVAFTPFLFTGCIQLTLALFEAIITDSAAVSKNLDNGELKKPVVTLTLSSENPESSVEVSWTKCRDNVDYRVFRSFTRDGETLTEAVYSAEYSLGYYQSPEKPSFTDTNLESGTEYSYVVKAFYKVTSNGVDSMKIQTSKPASITTQKDEKCTLPIPGDITVKAEEPLSLTVSWSPVEGATSYHVFSGKESVSPRSDYINVSGTSATFSHLNTNSDYSYRVQAWNEGGEYSLVSKTATGTPTLPENTSKESAFTLTGSVSDVFSYNALGTYWFSCTPNKGVISISNHSYADAGEAGEEETYFFSVYKADGSTVAEYKPITYADYSINGFVPDTEIFIMVRAKEFRICVE